MFWSSPSAGSPSEHSKKVIPDYFVSQNSSKTSALSQGREAGKPFLLCRSPPVPAQLGLLVPVLVPSIQVGLGPLPPPPSSPAAFPNPFFPRVLRLRRAEFTARRLILSEGFFYDFIFVFESTG